MSKARESRDSMVEEGSVICLFFVDEFVVAVVVCAMRLDYRRSIMERRCRGSSDTPRGCSVVKAGSFQGSLVMTSELLMRSQKRKEKKKEKKNTI